MAQYRAVIMHGKRDSEGWYDFEGPDDLFTGTPIEVMRAFMTEMDAMAHIGHIGYEVNAAMKNQRADTVTVLGQLHFDHGGDQPFICMISPKPLKG